MPLLSFRKFRESVGLGDMTPKTDVMGPETELMNDLMDLIRRHADKLRKVIIDAIDEDADDFETNNDLKQIVGLIGNLRDSPRNSKDKPRDPLSNVVTRSLGGPDGPGGGMGGGSGEG